MSAELSVGVDVGGTSTRVGIVDPSGGIVDLATSATPVGPDAIANHLATEIAAALRRAPGTVATVGVGIPGRVDGTRGVLAMAVNLGITRPVALGTLLEGELGVQVTLGNDVDLAALGAHRHLAAVHGEEVGQSLTYLSIGTGLAIGLVLGGHVHHGHHGAGEIGHVPMPGLDQSCPCGQVGCPETVASGSAMMRAWGRPDADVVALWDAADNSDERAEAVRRRAVEAIVWTLQCTSMVFDPDTIVIGGGVSRLGGRLLHSLTTTLDVRGRQSPFVASYRIAERLRIAPEDAQFGVIGAALVARTDPGAGHL
jgi:predicted NBD/HSP70 family sugar kinase